MLTKERKEIIEKTKIYTDIISGKILEFSSDQIKCISNSYFMHHKKAIKNKEHDKAVSYFLISSMCFRFFDIKYSSEVLNEKMENIGSQGKVQIKLSTNT